MRVIVRGNAECGMYSHGFQGSRSPNRGFYSDPPNLTRKDNPRNDKAKDNIENVIMQLMAFQTNHVLFYDIIS